MGLFDFDNTPDWVNTNESDGATFYGYDDDCDDYLQRY